MSSSHFQVSRKVLALVCIIALTVSMFSTYAGLRVFGQAGTSLTTNTLTGGVNAGAPAYTIFTENGYTYAKDAYGAIDYSSTNASYVINTALANANGEVKLAKGTYTLTSPIIYNSNTDYAKLSGESSHSTLLNGLALADYAFQVGDGTNNAWHFFVSDLSIYGGTKILESAQIYFNNVGFGNSSKWSLWCEDSHELRFSQCEVYYGSLGGMKVIAANNPASDLMFDDGMIYGSNNYLMNLESTSNSNIVRDSTFSNTYFEVYPDIPGHGVVMNGSVRVNLIGNTIAGYANTTCDLLQVTGVAGAVNTDCRLVSNHIWRSGAQSRYACYVYGSVNHLYATDNSFYGVSNDLHIDASAWRFRFENNNFQTGSLDIATSLGGTINHNYGFITEKSGLALSQVDGSVIAIGLSASPDVIQLTTNSPLQTVGWSARNATHITLSLCWANGTIVDSTHSPAAVSWYVAYNFP